MKLSATVGQTMQAQALLATVASSQDVRVVAKLPESQASHTNPWARRITRPSSLLWAIALNRSFACFVMGSFTFPVYAFLLLCQINSAVSLRNGLIGFFIPRKSLDFPIN
jgi:hypothetical protein